MKWLHWARLPADDKWTIIHAKMGKDDVYLIICNKHEVTFCGKCSPLSKPAARKLKMLRKMALV